MSTKNWEEYGRRGGQEIDDDGLTDLQREIRDLLREGMSQADIARETQRSRQHVSIVKKRLEELGAL